MENHWWQFSPRVGFAWDPKGDGRMSIRTGYSLSYDFVNAQFHLNTSVAPPFNAEARMDNPVGGFDNPWLGTGNETFFPFTTGPNSVFPLTGPYISIPSDIRVPRQQSWNVSVQRQVGNDLALVGHLSGELFGPPVERALAQSRRLHPGLVHAADGDRAADVQPVLDHRDAQQPPRAHDGELRHRQVSRRRGRAHRARLPEVQRPAAQRAAPQRQRHHRQRQLHAVEVHGAAHAGRHHAERRHRLRGSDQSGLRLRSVRHRSPASVQHDARRADAGLPERDAARDRVRLEPVRRSRASSRAGRST